MTSSTKKAAKPTTKAAEQGSTQSQAANSSAAGSEVNLQAAQDFLAALGYGTLTFQTFDDVRERKEKRSNLIHMLHGTLQDHAAQLQELNRQGAGIFVCINQTDGKGRRAKNIIRVRAVYADFDVQDTTRPDRLLADALPPSIVVESSPGKHHAYWLTNDIKLTEFQDLQKRIIGTWPDETDGSVNDLPRVLRLPGFLHRKEQPQMVQVVFCDPARAYTAQQMHERFAPLPEPVAAAIDAPLRPRKAEGATIVELINSAYDLDMLLQRHGYAKHGCVWLAPTSESGSPGVRMLRRDGKPVLYSHHGASDPLSAANHEGHALDTADALCALEYGGNFKRMIRTESEQLDPEGQQQRQREYMQQQSQNGAIFEPLEDDGQPPLSPDVAPEPLRAPIAKAAPYPVEHLGNILGPAVKALQQKTKTPLALCAQAVLGAASLAVQAHFDVRLPWSGSLAPTSLFMLTVGESGERKSTLDGIVLGAAREVEREQLSLYYEEMKRFQLDLDSWKKAVEHARQSVTKGKKGTVPADVVSAAVEAVGARPEPPISPMRFVSDPTMEGIFILLNQAQPSLGLFSAEGGQMIGGHAMNQENRLKTFAFLSNYWDGAPQNRTRAQDGATTHYGRRLALHLQAQGDVMQMLLNDDMANSQGFLARCLIAWPESTIGTRLIEHFEWAVEHPAVTRMLQELGKLLQAAPRTVENKPQELDPQALALEPAAIAAAIQYVNHFERLQAPGQPFAEITGTASKAMENALRLAAVMTVVEEGLIAHEIKAHTLARAVVLMQWYLYEVLRIKGQAQVPQETLDAEMLLGWLQQKGIKRFRTATILQGGPNPLRAKTRLKAATDLLVQTGHIQPLPPGTEVEGVKAKSAWELRHVV